jgi:hypothetical protein
MKTSVGTTSARLHRFSYISLDEVLQYHTVVLQYIIEMFMHAKEQQSFGNLIDDEPLRSSNYYTHIHHCHHS